MAPGVTSQSSAQDRRAAGGAHYCEFAPGAALGDSIECFWRSTIRDENGFESLHRVLPDGCMDLLFDLSPQHIARASIIGTMTRGQTVVRTGRVELVGVRFRPGGLSRFLRLDAGELTDARAELSEFWGRSARDVCRRLQEAPAERRIDILQDVLRNRAGQAQPDAFVQHCVARIEASHGAFRMSDLERSTGFSARQLERKFARHVGISPKTFARVVRLRSVIAALRRSNTFGWADLAGEFGFADQPHFAREFKALCGVSPSEYASQKQMQSDVGILQDGGFPLN